MGVKGRAGRRPKTTAQRAIDGSEDRKRHHQQPVPVDDEPICPQWMSETQRGYWAMFAELLRGQRRLTVDTGVWLETVVRAYAKWRQLLIEADAVPIIMQTPVGPKAHPAHHQERLALLAYLKLLVEAGLTPTSISRIAMPSKEDAHQDTFASFQAQRGPGLRRVK